MSEYGSGNYGESTFGSMTFDEVAKAYAAASRKAAEVRDRLDAANVSAEPISRELHAAEEEVRKLGRAVLLAARELP